MSKEKNLTTASKPATDVAQGATVHARPQHVVLGVCGGIAAYKSALLARLLVAQGHEVQVVMTASAKGFVGAHTFQALTGRAVRDTLWDEAAEAAMGHIELARWADVIVIAPATAHTMARLSHGFADDLLTTLCLASDAPLVLAPAMNQAMWRHPATQTNCEILQQRGVIWVGPDSGDQACGDIGPGRMSEPKMIAHSINDVLKAASSAQSEKGSETLSGRHVLVTAGPTYEDIDPVRYIANRSSGRMGYAIAEAARSLGANVTLVSGPVRIPPPEGVEVVSVRSALAMHEAVMTRLARCDIFIAAAAVADFRPAESASHKIKKQYQQNAKGGSAKSTEAVVTAAAADMSLALVANPDILAEVCAQKGRTYCVGFAAETEHLRDHAQAKRQRKGADLIAANWVGEGRGFDVNENELLVLGDDFECALPSSSKTLLAERLMDIIAQRYQLTN
ncbi:MAG: bifunctional phosphopantothenoylcysteine decarboxylase/phosphopantothenate--cysteine ligase CoaBC [Xanthomonadales bacterium]|nr:bifunctional phosphopantothenoylcysteine decarboxylase/phosphopantothenate--cysteine ligase CoaBC [Xanthomonadales bacterium]